MVTFLNFYIRRQRYENIFMKRYKLCLEKTHPFYIHLFLQGLPRARLRSRQERTLFLVQSLCTTLQRAQTQKVRVWSKGKAY